MCVEGNVRNRPDCDKTYFQDFFFLASEKAPKRFENCLPQQGLLPRLFNSRSCVLRASTSCQNSRGGNRLDRVVIFHMPSFLCLVKQTLLSTTRNFFFVFCGLFRDSNIEWKGDIWIGRYVEGSGCGWIQDIPAFNWKDWGKPRKITVRAAGLRSGIWTWDLPNRKQEC
jgi:hypothetical protein